MDVFEQLFQFEVKTANNRTKLHPRLWLSKSHIRRRGKNRETRRASRDVEEQLDHGSCTNFAQILPATGV